MFKTKLAVVTLSVAYLLVMLATIGIKAEHLLIVGAYNLFFWLNGSTRKIVLSLSVLIIFALLYDSMKLYPNYLFNAIDISGVYNLEKSLFGITDGQQLLTPNEYFAIHHAVFADLLAGFFYINWMPIPVAFGVFLYFKNKKYFLQYCLAFLFVNVLGFIVYYLHPAAPPWYVAQYGFDVHFNTPGNTAGLARVDQYLGINLFGSIYSRNANVFAAMPSLHSAYPVVVLYYAIKGRYKYAIAIASLFMLGVWYAAVYSGHHYTLDVLCGIACALTGLLLFDQALCKTRFFNTFISNYVKLIA